MTIPCERTPRPPTAFSRRPTFALFYASRSRLGRSTTVHWSETPDYAEKLRKLVRIYRAHHAGSRPRGRYIAIEPSQVLRVAGRAEFAIG